MRNIFFVALWVCWCACGSVAAQEVIAEWGRYQQANIFVFLANGGNSLNHNIATLAVEEDRGGTLSSAPSTAPIPTSNLWNKFYEREQYWIITFSTQGYNTLTVASTHQSTGVGPRDFQVQYKIGTGEWYNIDGATVSVGTGNTNKNISLPNELNNKATVSLRWLLTSNVSAGGGTIQSNGNGVNRISITIKGTPIPPKATSTWNPSNNSTNWNDAGNWSNGAIPDANTNVIINSGCNSYPILEKETNATCDTIFFETQQEDMVGSVAKTCYLQYNAAVVKLWMSSRQYHLVSPPLCNVYTGDYFTQSALNPEINPGVYRAIPSLWMKLYQAPNPQKPVSVFAQGWSGYFNTLDYEMMPGSGLCVWLGDTGLPEADRTKDNLVISFPKDSIQYSYFNEYGDVNGHTNTLQREKKSRFVYENANNYDPETGEFEIAVTSDFIDGEIFNTAIVGNPFMSHLNFSKFQEANSDKIERVYRIWGGDSFENSVLYGDAEHSLEDVNSTYNYIAPMQSFVVVKKEAYQNTALGSLQFTPEMSEICPGAGLRSASYVEGTPTSIPKHTESSIKINVENNHIHVYAPSSDLIKSVCCYDMQGRLINQQACESDNRCTIAIPDNNIPMVILKLRTNTNTVVKKVYLK